MDSIWILPKNNIANKKIKLKNISKQYEYIINVGQPIGQPVRNNNNVITHYTPCIGDYVVIKSLMDSDRIFSTMELALDSARSSYNLLKNMINEKVL